MWQEFYKVNFEILSYSEQMLIVFNLFESTVGMIRFRTLTSRQNDPDPN